VYTVAGCRVTCRHRTEPGDFVSRQVLGCHNAVRAGTLATADRDAALAAVAATVSVVGIIGPEGAAEKVAAALARRLSGAVVTESGAVVWADPVGACDRGGGSNCGDDVTAPPPAGDLDRSAARER